MNRTFWKEATFNSQQDALTILHLFVVPQFFWLRNIYLIINTTFRVDLLPCSSHVHRNQKTWFLSSILFLSILSSCILAFLLRLVLFAKYRTRKSWADLELELKKAFFACLLFYCSILLKFHVEYDSEYDQSNKKKIQPLTLQMVLPIPPIYCKDYSRESQKKKSSFDHFSFWCTLTIWK